MFYYPVLACPLSQRADTPRSGSGNGPERALEANNKIPSAQRESPSSPELPQRAQDRSRGAPNTPSVAGSVRSEPWKRSPKPLAHSAKAPPSQSFLSERRTDPAEPPTRQAERDRSAASLGSEHQNPSRTARKPLLPKASSARAGPIPRSAKTRQAERDRSEASLGGDHQSPSRTARKPHPPPSLLSARRTDPAERQNTPSGAGSVRSEPWKRSPKSLARSAKAQSSPELPQRAQDRSRGAPHTPSGAGSVRSKPWKRTPKTHRAQRESPILPRASSASAGPIPRSAHSYWNPAERSTGP